MSKLAAFVSPGRSLEAAVERVRLAEELGYEAAFATQTTGRDGLMTLAAYAPTTARIRLGTGVLPAFPRHPVATAIEAATLDEISGGRLILGLGMAHRITMENWYGFDMSKPLSRFKEYVRIVRSVFRTGRAEMNGEYYNVNFGFIRYEARADLPIYTASLGPNSLRFAGAEADGIVLWACLPRYIREVVVPQLHAGARDAGRDPAEIEIVAAVPVAVCDDVEAARAGFRKEFFVYMTLPFYRRAIGGAGYQEEIERFDAAMAAGDMAGARAAISDRMLDEFTGIGDATAVRAKIEDFRAAGVTMPAIGPIAVPPEAGGSIEATFEAAVGA